jgi:hypothetical protein
MSGIWRLRDVGGWDVAVTRANWILSTIYGGNQTVVKTTDRRRQLGASVGACAPLV